MRFSQLFPATTWVWRHLASRGALIVAGVFIALVGGSYLSLRGYLLYEAHRANQMMTALAAVKIGAPESSALSIIHNYGGFRWTPDKTAPERFEYVVQVNPWYFGSLINHRLRFEDQARRIVDLVDIDPDLRRSMRLRMWLANGGIVVRDGRVHAVHGEVMVEGEDEWLGADWNLSGDIPSYVRDRYSDVKQPWPELDRYVVGWTHLHVGSNGAGEQVRVWVTSGATETERREARQMNLSCLTSHRACRALCDLMPDAARYHKDHPEASWGGRWGEPERTCE